ncbi:uncharacterized protein HMPREF1541_06940 [Cyphellophora europaea CBS 101466]|uniref:Amidoligase enzyme n=1 Tax=Cyphellophora europaea (strain CBS 101466) TaxID=1220924 RepID=W2RT43_CYPE1|nr:uncharacterized protein HMPREF1541_06940 [Cyphellophora europaea CBS 101466]ETN38898.1 hypothetical protein HMPREF1541_06940 [Cyphellophora europaea CBS 101466]
MSTSPKRTAGTLQDAANPTKKSKTADHEQIDLPPIGKGSVVTFGVELECNIIFSEHELTAITKEYSIPYHHIQKGHPVVHGAEYRVNDNALLSDDPSNTCRTHYPSWTLAVAYDKREKPVRKDPFHPCTHYVYYPSGKSPKGPPLRIRKLFSEHLLLAKKALSQHKLPVDVCGEAGAYWKIVALPKRQTPGDFLTCQFPDYTQWTLTNDSSLIGFLKSQLVDKVSYITKQNQHEYDSMGLELISPVFQLSEKDASLDLLGQYLAALRAGPMCTIRPSVWTGLHVHLGLATRNTNHGEGQVDEWFVRHLLYTILLHEDLISQCFPRDRSGETPLAELRPVGATSESDEDPTAEELEEQWRVEEDQRQRQTAPTFEDIEAAHDAKELEAIQANDEDVLAAESKLTNELNLLSNAWYLTMKQDLRLPLHENTHQVRDFIFAPVSLARVLTMVQGSNAGHDNGNWEDEGDDRWRGFIYNFSNLHNWVRNTEGISRSKKPTIEFRQHEGCVDTGEIRRWVDFLEALAKKADEMRLQAGDEDRETGAQGLPYPVAFPFRNIRDFCEWLILPEVDVLYWVERWEKHHLDRPSEDARKRQEEDEAKAQQDT